MARDLSLLVTNQSNSVSEPSAQQTTQEQANARDAGLHRDCNRNGYSDLLTDSATDSDEGDGGDDSDDSFDNVAEHGDRQGRLGYDEHIGLQGGVDVQGEQLYRQFLARRLAEERLSYPNHYQGHVDHHHYQGHRDQVHLSTDLAALADRFSRSIGRDQVRQKAEQVDLASLTQDNFTVMVSELFHDGGITQERILVLFFFCSDLAIRACRAGLSCVLSSVTRWTLTFMRGTVAVWVRCRGGWDRVLRGGVGVVSQLAFIGVCAAVIGACAVYIRKNL